MEQKNYTEVLIDGTIYTLGGLEEEFYLRKVAAYLNEKIGKVRRQDGFRRLNADYQNLTIHLNIADDYFKEQERADILAEQKAALEKDAYSLKHELITTQMKLESVEKELETARRKLQEAHQAALAEGRKNRAVQQAVEAEGRKNRAEQAEDRKIQAEQAEDRKTQAEQAAEAKSRKTQAEQAAEAEDRKIQTEQAVSEEDKKRAEEEKQKALRAAAAALASKGTQRRKS